MTLAQIEHTTTLSDPLPARTARDRMKRACRDHDAELDLAARLQRLVKVTITPEQCGWYAGMLKQSERRIRQLDNDIITLARLLVAEAEVTE